MNLGVLLSNIGLGGISAVLAIVVFAAIVPILVALLIPFSFLVTMMIVRTLISKL